jgi:hypothetical protein
MRMRGPSCAWIAPARCQTTWGGAIRIGPQFPNAGNSSLLDKMPTQLPVRSVVLIQLPASDLEVCLGFANQSLFAVFIFFLALLLYGLFAAFGVVS